MLAVRWRRERGGSACGRNFDLGSSLHEGLGRWDVKLAQCGLIGERVQQSVEPRPSGEFGIRAQIEVEVATIFSFEAGCVRLYELLSRSLGPDKIPTN